MWPEGTITDILNRTNFELQGKQNIKITHLRSIQIFSFSANQKVLFILACSMLQDQ